MPLNKEEIDDILRSVGKILFTQSVLLADYVDPTEYKNWIELDVTFRENILDHFEETLYQRLGVQ